MLNEYFQDIFKTSKTKDATEPSYYPDLKKLLVTYLEEKGRVPNITVNPKKTSAGMPDFTIRRGHELIGYIEAKDPKYEDLDDLPARDTEQLERYKDKLPNLILTNYFDFWLWRKEEKRWIKKVRIGMPRVFNSLRIAPPAQKEDEFFDLLAAFFNFYIPERKTAQSLAEELAGRAQLLPSYIIDLLSDNKDEEIDRIYKSFTEFLIPDLSKEDFADIYAQTITYGLFTARLLTKNGRGFNRFEAQGLLPKNLPILYYTFNLISSSALPESIEWLVTEITTVLANADMEQITKELTLRKGEDDPFIHFYEDFLAAYDPKKKKGRGVYYTPFPVVSYITQSINQILKDRNHFNLEGGFANKNVTSLDFASGTLTFPVNAIKIGLSEFSKWNPDLGGTSGLIKNHILKNFYAFEILMAPYVLGHLKASLILREYGYNFDSSDKDDRFNLFLTNTLDFDPVKESNQPFTFYLSEEGKSALSVKKDKTILVVMGNPPYKKHSINKTAFTEKEMGLYKEDVKDEQNIQPLSDDYIKFIRFAHWKIEQIKKGVIGIITNNSYLYGLIHRGMRKKLLESFNEIYILNLHGDTNVGEVGPNGERDQNVFDIKQGVAIALLVKLKDKIPGELGKLYYQELWGSRESKYSFLNNYKWESTSWQTIQPNNKNFFFCPVKTNKNYENFTSVSSIFNEFSSGIVTGRDDLFINISKDSLKAKMFQLFDKNESDDIVKTYCDLTNPSGIKILSKRKGYSFDGTKILTYFYRPFDLRYIYFEPKIFERARFDISRNLLEENLALVTSRLTARQVFNNVIVIDSISDYKLGDSTRGSYVFPLYLYNMTNKSQSSHHQQTLLDDNSGSENPVDNKRVPNIKSEFIELITVSYKSSSKPIDIFNYIYAILFSDIFRHQYAEDLRKDFPKIPFTSKSDLFLKLAKLGENLISFHLLKNVGLNKPISRFFGKDSEYVEDKIVYKDGKIYVNESQYFDNVQQEVWDYCIGGYPVLDRWLKERSGKHLDENDIRHVCKVITAISKTLEIQKEVDKLYPEVEKNLLKFA